MSAPTEAVNPLARLEGEPKREHRGLLLYAMLDPGVKSRSYRFSAQIQGFADATHRRWAQEWGWAERIEACGGHEQAYAIRCYGEEYPQHYEKDRPKAELRMSVPFVPGITHLPSESPPSVMAEAQLQEEAREEARRRVEAARPEPQSIRSKQMARREELNERDRAVKRNLGVVTAAIGLIAKKLAHGRCETCGTGELKIGARDLPRLIETWAKLSDLREGGSSFNGMAGPSVAPSVRVRLAEQANDDIGEALLADARECVAILEGLQASKEVAAQVGAIRAQQALEAERELEAGEPAAEAET